MTQAATASITAPIAVHPAPYRRPAVAPAIPEPALPPRLAERCAPIATDLDTIAAILLEIPATYIRHRIRAAIAAIDAQIARRVDPAPAAHPRLLGARDQLVFVDLQLAALGLDCIHDRLRLAAGLLAGAR